MKRFGIVLGVLIVSLLAIAPARATAPFFNDKGASNWMTYYYVDKDTAHVGAFLHWIASCDFAKNPNFEDPATGFLAALFIDNPSAVRDWISGVKPNDGAKAVIERALWLAGQRDLITEIYRETPDYTANTPPALKNLALDTPGMWDVMWAAFSATGDTAYPARLIDLLDEAHVFSKDPKIDTLYRRIVAWSLQTNAGQHELILRMLRTEAARRDGAIKQKLDAMVTEVEKQRVVTNDCDGEFCALLALISEDNLKELDKPSYEVPVLTELGKAKPGDHIAATISFSGMALREDLSAEVTYDIHTLRPDGALYDGEHTDLVALKRKVAQRFSIYDNRTMLIMLRFEPKDPRGTYRVQVTLKDKVGGRTITLEKKITLTD